MILPLSLFISLRFRRSRYRNNMLSIISMISTIGIALGLSTLIVGLSITNGFKYELNNRILSVIPHGEIETTKQPWSKWREILKKIEKIPGVIIAAPYINFTGIIENETNLRIIQIKGINSYQKKYLSKFIKFINNKSNNNWTNFKSKEQQIFIGKGIADTLNIKQDDWISVLISDFNKYKNNDFRQIKLHVTGIFHIGNYLDYNFAIVPLEDASLYMNTHGGITGIDINVNNIFSINRILLFASRIYDNYKYTYVKSWIDSYNYIYKDIKMIRSIIYLAMTMVILISCFNIFTTLLIVSKEKNIDIAILCTLGATNNLINNILIWHGFITGLIGSFYGVIIGTIISLKLTSIFNIIEKLIGYNLLSKNVYFINFLPSKLDYLDIVYALTIVILFSLLSSFISLRKVVYINPIKILNSNN